MDINDTRKTRTSLLRLPQSTAGCASVSSLIKGNHKPRRQRYVQPNTSYCLGVYLEDLQLSAPSSIPQPSVCIFRHDMPLNAFHRGRTDHVIIYLCQRRKVLLSVQPLPDISNLKHSFPAQERHFLLSGTSFHCSAVLEPRTVSNLFNPTL